MSLVIVKCTFVNNTSSMSEQNNKDDAQLKLRRVAIDTYHENVAYLNRRCRPASEKFSWSTAIRQCLKCGPG